MKKYILLLSLIISSGVYCQKNIYESIRFDELSETHRILAIVPFLTNLDLDDTSSKEELGTLEKEEGYAVQNALETYFSRGKKRKKFTIAFQDVERTNAILAENNITYKNMDVYTIEELSKILKVDGIISGTLDLNILLSKGVSTNFNLVDFFMGNSTFGRIGIKISDGKSGKLLWKYEKEITKKTGKNTLALIEDMMKRAARKFPYEKERLKRKRRD